MRKDERLSTELRNILLNGKNNDFQTLYSKLGVSIHDIHSSRRKNYRIRAIASFLIFIFSAAISLGGYLSLDHFSDNKFMQRDFIVYILGSPLTICISACVAILSFGIFLVEFRTIKRKGNTK